MTIKQILHRSILELKKSGTRTPELDARILLGKAIKKENSFVFSHPDYLVTNSQYSLFRSYIRRRKAGEPVAYILGQKEFYGLDFTVNKNVLIPRPETEWLVEKSIAFLQNYELRIKNYGSCYPELVSGSHCAVRMLERVQHDNFKKINVLDIGTGSGCIIISLVKALHDSKFMIHDSMRFYASDISKKALKVAKKNAKNNQVANINFYISDLFLNRYLNKKFDLIVANLPYVPRSAKNLSIDCEPTEAIFADDNGTAVIKQFLNDAKGKLNDDGLILLETDCRNAKQIFEFTKKCYPEAEVKLTKDLAKLDRYIEIKK